MDTEKELKDIKVKTAHMNAAITRLQTKHHQLSHRLDGLDEELSELWEVVGINPKEKTDNDQ